MATTDRPSYRFVLLGALVSLFLLSGTDVVSAQSMWTPPYRTNQVTLEWILPAKSGGPLGVSDGGAYLDFSFAATRHLEFIVELPFAYRGVGTRRATSMVGNPYVAIGIDAVSVPLLLEVGTRIPVASDDAALDTGAIVNVGRTNAFRDKERNASALLSWRYLLDRHLSVRLRGGGVAVHKLEESVNPGWRARLRYGAQLWYEKSPVIMGLTALGRVTPSRPGSFRAKSVHHIVGTAMVDLGPVQPGILIGAPVDRDLWEEVPLLVGLTLSASYQQQ